MISNIITMGIYLIGIGLWLTIGKKMVPIPTRGVDKITHYLIYSPLWHIISPVFFIAWFFLSQPVNYCKKKLKLTISFCLAMPTFYFFYCFLRSKLSPAEYFDRTQGFSRWPYEFLSSKKMAQVWGNWGVTRFTWKIVLVIFWFSLFSLITYFSLRMAKRAYRKGKLTKYVRTNRNVAKTKKNTFLKNSDSNAIN